MVTGFPHRPRSHRPRPTPFFGRSRGFALIVTISLMVLLMVIGLGLLTLSAISMRSQRIGSAQSVARANARLALLIAIGDLQKHAGPDQRVTATGARGLFPHSVQSIGNSYAHPYLKPESARRRWQRHYSAEEGREPVTMVDHSYLANKALWDDYFFSSIAPHRVKIFESDDNKSSRQLADAFFFGDDWSDQRGVMVGPERWRKMFKPRYEKIYRAAKEQGKIVMTHCCGSVVGILDDLIEIGLDVLESVQPEAEGMNPYALKKQWGDKMTFWGCLGSQSTIPFGTPDEIRAEVAKLKREMSRGGGYILAPAKSLRAETPVENAIAIIESFNTVNS